MTSPYQVPNWVDVTDPANPPANAVPITASRLRAIGDALVQVFNIASAASTAAASASAAVQTSSLRALIWSVVRAMFPTFSYDSTTGVLTPPVSGGTGGGGTGGTTPDPVVTQPTGEVYIESYKADAGTGGDDTAAINAAFAAASGKTVKLANKIYYRSGLVNITRDNVTVDGSSGGKIVATNQALSSFKVSAKGCTLRDLVIELQTSTGRFDPYNYQLLLIVGSTDFKAIRVTTRKSAATGFFITRTNGFTLTDCVIEDSRADGFHITGGSSNGTSTNCLALRPGDDGHAVVSYVGGSDGGVCDNVEFNNPKVRQQSVRGRGCTVVGGTNITYNNVDIDGTWGPGIYVAAEPYGNNPTNGVNTVLFNGGTISNAHSTTAISNGSILIASSRSGVSVQNVTIRGITTYNTRATLPFEFGVYSEGGGLLSNINMQSLKAVNGSTRTLLYTNQPATVVIQSDITKSTAGGSAGAVPTTVRVTSTTTTSNSATVAWEPVAGTDGITLSGVTTTITGGTQLSGTATGSRTFTALSAGQSYTVSIQPFNNGAAYGSPVVTTVAIPAGTTTSGTLTSDSFSGSGELIGRSTDIAAGGTAQTWVGTPAGGYTVANGKLTRGTNAANSFAGVPTGGMNVEAGITVGALPTGDGFFLDLHRQSSTVTDSPNAYRLQVIVTGSLRLLQRIGGAVTELANLDSKGLVVAGDKLLFRYSQGRLEVLNNGTLLTSLANTAITTPGFAGIAVAGTNTGLSLDDFTLASASTSTTNDNQTSLRILRTGLTNRQTAACNVVFTGSSTTFGSNASTVAKRYVNLLTGYLQAAYPSGTGSEPAVVASASADFGTISTTPGVHAYNAGDPTTLAANYLTATERTNIAALNPRMVMHMIGSNDYANQVPIATYKANVLASVNDLRSKTTGPCVHVLVQAYQRMDLTNPSVPWSAYAGALAELAAAAPSDVAYVDLTGSYQAAGVPGDDPQNLIDTDNVHQTDAGHALMADLLYRALIARAPGTPNLDA